MHLIDSETVWVSQWFQTMIILTSIPYNQVVIIIPYLLHYGSQVIMERIKLTTFSNIHHIDDAVSLWFQKAVNLHKYLLQ